jgi:hypothetical protein
MVSVQGWQPGVGERFYRQEEEKEEKYFPLKE